MNTVICVALGESLKVSDLCQRSFALIKNNTEDHMLEVCAVWRVFREFNIRQTDVLQCGVGPISPRSDLCIMLSVSALGAEAS